MMPRSRWQNAAGAIMLAAVLVYAAGCQKQLAKINANKARKLVGQADQFNAQQYPQSKAPYDQAVSQMSQAENMLASDPKQASTVAREAVKAAKDALRTAKKFDATRERDEADHEVNVMKINNGNMENPELYQGIIETQTKMHEKYNKERWVGAIELARRIKEDVDRLLLRLQREARDDLVAVNTEYQRLVDEGGEQHAPLFVERVRQLITEIENNIQHPTKDYLTAIEYSKQAMSDAQEGITESKRKKCEIAIETIQRKLITAQTKKAEFFQPDLWSSSSDDFARLVENFWKKEYDFVLKAAPQLEKQVDTLIYETRKSSAQYQIDKLEQRITDLDGKGVEKYLPGRLAPVKTELQRARGEFDKELFEDVEEICKTAQLNADEIVKDFSDMAQKWINTGRKITQVAGDLYKDMERIFDAVHPEYVKPQDQALENNKQAVRSELGRKLTQANEDIQQAQLKFDSEEYEQTIETSRAVENESKEIIATIYNVVAHNVITEIEDEITRYDREGADRYAASEMGLAKKLIGEAIELRNQEQYQASASKAAEARAELERAIEAIQQAASDAIHDAELALEASDRTKTSELQPEAYLQVQTLINEARRQREATDLAKSIETAQTAATRILRASQEAAMIWADQTGEEANVALAEARKVGADIYAAQLLNDAGEDAGQAGRLYASAQDLLGEQKYAEARDKFMEAKDLSLRASESATRAKFRLIDEAEAAIVEARSYEAWRTNLPGLTEAVLTLDASRDAMAAGDYPNSHELAQEAQAEALKITKEAKTTTLERRLEVLDELIAESTNSGGRYFQPQVLAGLMRELDRLRTQYDPATFDSSAATVDEIESHLQEMVDSMPNVVAEWLRIQNEKLTAVAESDIPPTFEPRIVEARKFLRFADLDYQRGKYRSAYQNLLIGRRLVDELSDGQESEVYREHVGQLLTDLDEGLRSFDHYLSIKPATLKGMTKGPEGDERFVAIAGRFTPAQFRERIEQLMLRQQAVHVPESMQEFHDEVDVMLRTAREAAIKFERLGIYTELSTGERSRLIDDAFRLIKEMRNQRNMLENTLTAEKTLAQTM